MNVALLGVNRRRSQLVIFIDFSLMVDTTKHQIQLVARLQRAADVGERHQRRFAERHFKVNREILLQ